MLPIWVCFAVLGATQIRSLVLQFLIQPMVLQGVGRLPK